MALDPIYGFTDYKKYIRYRVHQSGEERGYKSRMAEAAQCQRSFISQVLNTKADFTSEQALGLTEFWALDLAASDYFLEMVSLARAGTPKLRTRIQRRLKNILEKQKDESIRSASPALQNSEFAATYYSHWSWSAIHLLVEIESFRSEQAIAERLHLPVETIRQALQILQSMGLVKRDSGHWISTKQNLHAPAKSIFSWLHHGSWREKANQNLRAHSSQSIHFTGVYTLSVEDRDRIEDILLNTVSHIGDIVRPSKEEDAVCLCVDWFQV